MSRKVLIGSPVRQAPEILTLFLRSLSNLSLSSVQADFIFIDDNDNDQSSSLLTHFTIPDSDKTIIDGSRVAPYLCNDKTHYWNEKLIWKIAEYKNQMIRHCLQSQYDYLFLVDSDLLLHSPTLEHLISSDKDIISEIFWTKWQPDSPELPQIWLYDQYSLVEHTRGEVLNSQDKESRLQDLINRLKKPGVYRVGGLGACTLISRKALETGLNYNDIYNITFSGEDRHFSIRAVSFGFELFVDTHYPAYHVYRSSDIPGARKFLGLNSTDLNLQSITPNAEQPITQQKSLIIKETSEKGLPLGLDHQVSSFITNYISRMYSCDYRIVTGYEGYQYLSPKYIHKLERKHPEGIQWYKENNVRCYSTLQDIRTLNLTEEQIIVECSFTTEVNSLPSKRTQSSTCLLHIKKSQDHWLVDYISLSVNDNPILGFSLIDLLNRRERRCKKSGNSITLMMLVRNEADRFLQQTLSHAVNYIDKVVILDDASTDNTVDVCKEILQNTPHLIVCNKEHSFANEILLRKQLWNLTVATNPDWILSMDADEIFEDSIIQYIRALVNQTTYDNYSFRLFDMWDMDHYREDTYWQAHYYYRTFLTRYQPDYPYVWQETPQHCGRLPINVEFLEGCQCGIRLKHYGWSTTELRQEKYKRYMQLDPGGRYGDINQYLSILQENPMLVRWE